MLQGLSNKLAKYLSPQVYESIFSGERDVTLTSSRKKLTICFTDIVGFTDASDQMESEDLTQLLNHYLSEMTQIALEYGATVDKYIGDAIMIFFGDPKSRGVEQDAVLCIEMAMAMQKRVCELQQEWRSSGFSKPFFIRVGIHTGYCTVGNFGAENRLDYTIVGSAVNLASRIESCAEPGSVCISEDTYLLVRDKFAAVPTQKFKPKGLAAAVQLYRVLDAGEEHAGVDVIEPGFELKIRQQDLTPEAKAKLKQQLQDVLQDLDD